MMLPALLLLLCLSDISLSQRETISFDFAWKFHRGDPAGESQNCSFPEHRTHMQCQGLIWTPVGRMNPKDCAKDCCVNPNCRIWQYGGDVLGCHQGFNKNWNCTNKPDKRFSGASRASYSPPPSYKYTQPTFDDSGWTSIDVPHDFVIYGKFGQQYDQHHGHLPRAGAGWYRKHFRIPTTWLQDETAVLFLQFDGVFQLTQVWVNGHSVATHIEGYTPFAIKLDTALLTSENVIVVRADASFGSGHWYEGGGIYRHVWLIKSSSVHLALNGGVFTRATGKTMYPQVTLVNEDVTNIFQCYAKFRLFDNANTQMATASSDTVTVLPKKHAIVTLQQNVVPKTIQQWSVETPYLYTLNTVVMCTKGTDFVEMDSYNTTVGFRDFQWTADAFKLNGEHVKLRGFSHHNDFAGTGVEVRPRIDLYQAQAARWAGSNAWRMSHNPYHPALYDILDGLGVMVWDENRDYLASHIQDMGVLVRRDRNHPSVVIWSLCNENECHQDPTDHTTQALFAQQIQDNDPDDRPISANEIPGNSPVSSTPIIATVLQVMGYSHMHNQTYDQWHQQHPHEAIVASECCSCVSQRGENTRDPTNRAYFPSWNADCIKKEVAYAYTPSRPWISGSLGVWTLFDYLGEPSGGWPLVSSSFGQFDLAGFSKSGAHYYHSWWLCNATHPGRPPVPNCSGTTVKISESWNPMNPPPGNVIHVLSDASTVSLKVNGTNYGPVQVDPFGYATFQLPKHKNLTTPGSKIVALGMNGQGEKTGQDSEVAASKPYKLKLTIDAPSPSTGTGSRLVLDGEDVALIGVRVEDQQGNLVQYANNNITFNIVSGPARIVGVGNGDPTSHEPNKNSNKRSVYHGLARLIVQSTVMSTKSDQYRQLLKEIDIDSGSVTTIAPEIVKPVPIVVKATAQGLQEASITIQTSVDEADLAVNLPTTQYPAVQQQQLQFP